MQKAAIILIIAFLYAITARFSFFLAAPDTVISPVWPPAGIALAAVLIYGNIALVGIFLGCSIANSHMFIGNDMTLLSFLFMLVPGIGGALQAYLGKFALIKLTGSTQIFQNTRSVLIFIVIAAFGVCVINATFGTFVLIASGHVAIADSTYPWLTWWIADAVGVVSVASIIMAWKEYWNHPISLNKIIKLMITWVLILMAGYITVNSKIELAYLFIPFAIWSAFQFDIRFSLLTALLISAICLYDATHHGYNLMQTESINASISLIQLFITIIYLTILLVHTILADRQKAYDQLQLLNLQLEKLVLDRTNALLESNKQLEIQKNKAIEAFEALKYSHARLMQSEKMASLGMLTAGVAHEIKHPLHAMTANMESIKQALDQITPLEDSIRKSIETLITAVHEGINRTKGVMADLCAFARSDEPDMVMTDLNRNIDSTLNLLSSEIKRNISIVKEYAELPPLRCHPGKINQVIMNILINAIHALQTEHEGKITIKTAHDDHDITLTIQDNGPGMKKETLEKLFTPFFTTKQSDMGSGLGLFISHNIIKEHHGNIIVKSELEKGTEFIITLPIRE